jgi:outer membrane protein assembly factor BamB
MVKTNLVFLGIKGSVLALDKTTGQRVWEKKLRGGSFVTLLVEKDQILAGAQGEIFCLGRSHRSNTLD